ncbi:MAG TPA: STAS domain-containing protein [Candidatus Baltobacteraceae bacterium]|jgi:anti-anti-sigma factor
MDSHVFSYKHPRLAPIEAFQRALVAAHESDGARLLLDLDGLPSLDVEAIRGLITILRRVRDAGGEIALHVTREDLKRTLAVTALDRVFTIAVRPTGVAA